MTVKDTDADQVEIGEGICWVSQQQLPKSGDGDNLNVNIGKYNGETANDDEDKPINIQKKLFSEQAPGSQDGNLVVDDLVIKRQEKTFEEMLESQLQKAMKPEKEGSLCNADVQAVE